MSSDPLLRIVLVSGVVVLALSLGIMVWMAILRVIAARRVVRNEKLIADLQSLFNAVVSGDTVKPPRLASGDGELVLRVWLTQVESFRDQTRQRLIELGRQMQLVEFARTLKVRPGLASRLLGVSALGRLKDHSSWMDLVDLVEDPSPIVSLTAARSLLHIDAMAGPGTLIDALGRRKDWPMRTVATTLTEADQSSLNEHLPRLIRSGTEKNLPRLIPLLGLLPPEATWPILHPLLNELQPVSILMPSLKVLQDSRGLTLVRLLAAHEEWPVRAQAATTLGRIGEQQDVVQLQQMLRDREWWVRYRAATALVNNALLSVEALDRLCGELPDPVAGDILRQALDEAML